MTYFFGAHKKWYKNGVKFKDQFDEPGSQILESSLDYILNSSKIEAQKAGWQI